MRHKLQIDRKVASLEDFLNARQSSVFWPLPRKLDVLEGLFLLEDAGFTRKRYAAANGISTRTLQRWIQQFNTGGLAFAMESVQCRPGRKRKVGLLDFRERILPMAEDALHRSGTPNTIKNLYEAAQSLGLVDASYATFRRRLKQTGSDYKRRRIDPTIDEWIFHTQTGRWPRRLKSFSSRRTRQEKLAWQRVRESFQQSNS